ncbi:2-hydroxyacyl-CoA dehydratase family protein [Paramicrobacterium fandaimingii]|uniref:2-hydroxyacyl-CoA dehydratase family protein n=1 Tax=Paramicrobacterium fandaimingii TaxID=2708079 RepID=UPI0014227660|nr:2-hydroxyacyl-CoA dehydratase family protein [Microbacterium fandaimingii]
MNDTRPCHIGIIGADVPRQIVLAAGAQPVRLFSAWVGEPTQKAVELLGATDVVALRLLDEILAGRYDELSGIVICNDTAANLRLFYVLRVLFQRGMLSFPIILLDAPNDPGDARERFVARQYEKLAAFCSELTDVEVDAETLATAATRERHVGRALHKMRERRAARECSGSAALAAYRAAATDMPEAAISSVDAASDTVAASALPIVVTGSSHPDGSLYDVVEEAGLVVFAEDHDAGDAAWLGEAADGSTAAEVYAALARMHTQRPPLAPRSRSRARAASLSAIVTRVQSRGVLALVRELDDAPAWDLAVQRMAMRSAGVPLEERVRISQGGALNTAADAAKTLRDRIVKESL